MLQSDKPLLNIPGGKLSYIKQETGTIHIQTEFSTYPSLRIVTTVVLEGAVLFKEASEWSKPLTTDDEYKSAQNSLIEQHDKIHEMAEKDNLPLLTAPDSTNKNDDTATKKDTNYFSSKIAEQEGIKSVAIFDNEGVILNASSDDEDLIISASASAFATYVLLLSERFNTNGFNFASFKSPTKSFCWLPMKNNIIGAEVDEPETALAGLRKMIDE